MEMVLAARGVWEPMLSDEQTIATHLVLALWKWDAKENYVDHFHWLNNTGLLDVEDVQAIAREVW